MDGYFCGWYFKCQSESYTLAIIPAVHKTDEKRTFSIQIITEEESWNILYEEGNFGNSRKSQSSKNMWRIGDNIFGQSGLSLHIDSPKVKVEGVLRFSNHTPIKYDIMGPFAFVPFMQCRHSVYSMYHRVDGQLCINGKDYVFENALGYWEGDRGHSFPKEYAWTQSFLFDRKVLSQGSMMLSVAEIPLAGLDFTGVIGIVRWKGKVYRIATYLGARVIQKSQNRLLVRQGNLELEARLLEGNAHSLQAPVNGVMSRTIHENIKCKAFYRLRKKGQTVFSVETGRASFEFEYE